MKIKKTATTLLLALALGANAWANTPAQDQIREAFRKRVPHEQQDAALTEGKEYWEGEKPFFTDDLCKIYNYTYHIKHYSGVTCSEDGRVLAIYCYMPQEDSYSKMLRVFQRGEDGAYRRTGVYIYRSNCLRLREDKIRFDEDGILITASSKNETWQPEHSLQATRKFYYNQPYDEVDFKLDDKYSYNYDGIGQLEMAVYHNDTATLQRFLDNGYDLNAPHPRHPEMSIFLALFACHHIGLNHNPGLADFLLKAGADFKARDAEGNNALLLAIRHYDYNSIAELLRCGADPNAANHAGVTPLMMCLARSGDMQTLLAAGADPLARDKAGRTAVHHAMHLSIAPDWPHECGPEDTEDTVHEANCSIARHLLDNVKVLLEKGVDINTQDAAGNTALHALVNVPEGHYMPDDIAAEVARGLLALGADPTIRNAAGQTPAQVAEHPEWRPSTIQLLTDAAAKR